VEQLGRVNPVHLDGDERLAFWINIYNALMMHVGIITNSLNIFYFYFLALLKYHEKFTTQSMPDAPAWREHEHDMYLTH
jgi:Protein of unknown function, DUF547